MVSRKKYLPAISKQLRRREMVTQWSFGQRMLCLSCLHQLSNRTASKFKECWKHLKGSRNFEEISIRFKKNPIPVVSVPLLQWVDRMWPPFLVLRQPKAGWNQRRTQIRITTCKISRPMIQNGGSTSIYIILSFTIIYGLCWCSLRFVP